jgi:1-acyl-sn-glycerol-3-phosphate acyltransferase
VLERLGTAAFSYSWTAVTCTEILARRSVRTDRAAIDRRARRWAKVLLRAWHVDVRVDGMERVPLDAPCVLIMNHQSYVDVVALLATLPRVPVFLAKRELGRLPLFGRVMATAGHVFVDRGKHERAMESIERAAMELSAGSPLAVFPEGTRATRPEIRGFKKGAFHLARKARATIVPIGIHGSLEAWPRGSLAPMPSRIDVRVGAPIPVADVIGMELDALIARGRREVAALAQLPLVDR